MTTNLPTEPEDLSGLQPFPVTYQQVTNYYQQFGSASPFRLRKETMLRIEKATGNPLVCYVSRTHHNNFNVPTAIDDSDVSAFGDLVRSIDGDSVDVLLVSNGGSAEATERIVTLLRSRFKLIRYLIPSNAYSAATLMCLSGDTVVMDEVATLGPIDPQINGVPARAILRAMETLEHRLKAEGPRALTAYMPLLQKYDLHLLEICKSAEELSKELAADWLSTYMLKVPKDDTTVQQIVDFLSKYDERKSHSRSINRQQARQLGLKVIDAESCGDLGELLRSLFNQYELWFAKSTFYKIFEDTRGHNWGRQAIAQPVPVGLPIAAPQGVPGPIEPIQ